MKPLLLTIIISFLSFHAYSNNEEEFPDTLIGKYESQSEDCILQVSGGGEGEYAEFEFELFNKEGEPIVRAARIRKTALLQGRDGNNVDATTKEESHTYRVKFDMGAEDAIENISIGHRDFPHILYKYSYCSDMIKTE